MGIGQVMTMPLFFASNAIYPLSMMPTWLQTIARFNPLTYQVDALRGLMIAQGQSQYGIGVDLLVLLVADIALVALGGWLYPSVAM
jgi:ABC-2 type transport system permease protein